jgi:hypothetical protein
MGFAPRWLLVAVVLAVVAGVSLAVALYQAAAA